MDYEERTIEVFDSANQTDNLLLESFKEEPEDVSPASLVVREDIEDEEEKVSDIEQAPEVKEIKQEDEPLPETLIGSCTTVSTTNNNSIKMKFESEEEETAAPMLPTESKPVIDFIDQHGLNLLVDSIEEFASREQQNVNPEPEICSEVNPDSELPDPSSKPHLSSFGIEAGCTDGLGLLCALAEQRFLEETKNLEEDERTDPLSRTHSCSPDMPYTLSRERPICRQRIGVRSSSFSSSRCQSPVLLNPAELEMRFKLAELQRKYKMKQKELAKLKAKKDKESNLTDHCALYVHPSAMQDCLNEESRKKKNKGRRSMSLDTLPLKMNSISDDTNQLVSSGENKILDRDVSTAQVSNPLLSPIKVTTKFSTEQHSEKAHHVFPNLVKISTKKVSESQLAPSNFKDTICKLKSSGKKKDKNPSTNIFQLWKEKKLLKLSQLSGKPYSSSNKIKTSSPKLKSFSKIAETPVTTLQIDLSTAKKTTSILEANYTTENIEVEDSHLKRKANSLSPEANFENVSVKRLKLETVQDEQEPTTEKELDAEASDSKTNEDDKTSLNTALVPKPKKREKRLSTSSDDVWNRRRSERIFLHDAGVILPSSLAYSDPNSTNSTGSGNKSPRSPEPPRKKMTRKELGLKKLKFKEAEKQNQMPLEMFLALRQCRLNEMRLANNMGLLTGTAGLKRAFSSQEDSSGSEGDLPLSQLLQAVKKHMLLPDLPTCQMQVCDLRDCQRVLMEEDDLYYAGYITAIQAPDVYGITLDRERGNRPHIFSREEMLEQTVKEIKPIHVKQIPEGTRVCAYWSQQYRCLYPGTVTKGNGEVSSEDTNTVFVEFDDGDSGRIPLEDVRLLIPDPNFIPSNNSTVEEDCKTTDENKIQECSLNLFDCLQLQLEDLKNLATSHNLTVEDNAEKSKLEGPPKGKTEKSSKSKIKSNAKCIKSGIKSQASKIKKKLKLKSKSEEKLKTKCEKNKKKSETMAQEETATTLLEHPNPQVGLLAQNQLLSSVELPLPLELTDENGNCIKPDKVQGTSKLGGKKLQKLKKCSYLIKKPKHHFGDSGVLEKIKSFKKSRKDKGESKINTKADKESSDNMSMETCSSGECKVKKRKKHKADHKHHHHHHKKHYHHHHKKHKKKNDPLGLCSPHPNSPVLTISVGTEPKGTPLSGDDSKVDMSMCCVSPGRSELSVKIKASPPSSSCLAPKTVEALSPLTTVEDARLDKNPQQKSIFLFPEKNTTKGSEKSVSLKAEGRSNKESSNETKPAKKHKERKISCEKSKIAAFLPARQLWRWSGKGYRRPGTKGKAKKEYFKAITRGKETIRVGDCAVFLSTGRPHLPYVGHIETMWQSWGGNTVVKVKWFYHPEETKGGKKLAHPKGALFQSPHVDENDVQTISHKCEVMAWSDYQKWCEKRGSSSKGSYENEDVYYLAGTYEPLTKVLTLEPGVS